MKNIKINDNWFYHEIDQIKLKKIFKSGKILSYRKQGKKKKILELGYNGNDYISIAKYYPNFNKFNYSAYLRFIINNYALVIDNIDAIEGKETKDVFNFYSRTSKFRKKKRYTIFKDEFFVKDEIDISKVIGIKIPEVDHIFYSPTFYDTRDKSKGIDEILKIVDELNIDIPFIDKEEKKLINRDEIKEYILRRSYEKSS